LPEQALDELWRILGLAVVAAVVGLAVGELQWALTLLLAGLLGWYYYNLVRLQRWLQKGRKYAPPHSWGLWEDVFTGIYRLQQRARKRNKRIVKLLNRFRESTAALPDGVVVLDRNGTIEWWNDSAERLLGLRYPQDVGQRITNLVRHPDFVTYMNAGRLEKRVVFESPVDDQVVLSARRVPYAKDQELLLVRDVTMFRRVEAMRRDFVANISHELRTPLTVMQGFLESLADDRGMSEDERRHAVDLMRQQAARMHRLVEDLMLLSRLEAGEREPVFETVPVPRLLAALRQEAELLNAEKKHHVHWEVDQRLHLRGVAEELDSAFLNLIVNAINYTPPGGEIRVRWYRDGDGAHFEVRDTGIGIAAHHIPRLTERFYRVDVARSRESGGSGLGLAIVKHILSRHHGTLTIRSSPGHGSTFRCDFPPELVVEAPEQEGDSPVTPPAA